MSNHGDALTLQDTNEISILSNQYNTTNHDLIEKINFI